MIIIIQAVVIVLAACPLFIILGNRQTHAARAWKKIALCFLAIAMVVAVLFPNTTNSLAHLVGIGRGADLLLYILTLAFISYVVNGYLQQQKEKDRLYRLARQVAIIDANERYNIRG